MDNLLEVNYEKRKNTDLFKQMHDIGLTNMSEVQNYLPIYNRFLLLNDTNYNSVNLNHSYYLSEIKNSLGESKNSYNCLLQNINSTSSTYKKNVFFKMAPLLDPFKYLIGKYNIHDKNLFLLPTNSNLDMVHSKVSDVNNSSYIDGLFSFLSSNLIHKYNFINGVDYYGSFVGIKNDFTFNIADDLEYIVKSDFFIANKDIHFKVDPYDFLLDDDANMFNKKLAPIVIDHNHSNKSLISVQSLHDDIFENLFVIDEIQYQDQDQAQNNFKDEHVTLETLKEYNIDMGDILNDSMVNNIKTTTIKSGSTCSSRTSYTSSSTISNTKSKNTDTTSDTNNNNNNNDIISNDIENASDYSESNEECCINATIPKFPIQIICMEDCENTLDDLIMNTDLSQEEWFSALMQIIMILITYQKAFSFTHNDLHTNNIMYNKTNDKFIYYCYKKKYYKVPTFNRIFKIIDFGRSIYNYNGKTFCSDSFQNGSDAATQYNTEPYFNENKPRLDPNYSFDLCRLACSIFDYVIEDLDDINDLANCAPIVRIIYEWCLDDNKINILYKNNGQERYPDFKLYKMISRGVHNHTPQAQLERKEFSKFCVGKNIMQKVDVKTIVNIDAIPNLV